MTDLEPLPIPGRRVIKPEHEWRHRRGLPIEPRQPHEPHDFVMRMKMRVAWEIVAFSHGDDAADRAEAHFISVYQHKQPPADMPEHKLEAPCKLVDLIALLNLASSKSEARRLIKQGGVKLDGERVEAIDTIVTPDGDTVLQVGKHVFVRLLGEML